MLPKLLTTIVNQSPKMSSIISASIRYRRKHLFRRVVSGFFCALFLYESEGMASLPNDEDDYPHTSITVDKPHSPPHLPTINEKEREKMGKNQLRRIESYRDEENRRKREQRRLEFLEKLRLYFLDS